MCVKDTNGSRGYIRKTASARMIVIRLVLRMFFIRDRLARENGSYWIGYATRKAAEIFMFVLSYG